ncbi:hypothetical protein [Methylocystis sp. B8]|uniref:BufA2 family periplasmic bufferin-type metallophore n=1 Tax=Methylocystis sp. B8 TaxID=544938 RepID=UPI0010FCFFE3|nr:hypothetical protein [Methylocystis sp. B8]TLG79060.1 hypothetical protein FEV16_03290 [Methylocystis sp. B8]
MKNDRLNGSALAVAAVSLVLAGTVAPVAAATTAKVHCLGANSCKGKSDCHTPKNACKGMNACKAQGWVFKETAQACEEAGGKVLD